MKSRAAAAAALKDALNVAQASHAQGETRLRDAALGDAFTTARAYNLTLGRTGTVLLHESLGLVHNAHPMSTEAHR